MGRNVRSCSIYCRHISVFIVGVKGRRGEEEYLYMSSCWRLRAKHAYEDR